MPALFDTIALSKDIPEENLVRGQVGTIVEIHRGGEAYEVEFADPEGRMYALAPLPADAFIVLRHVPVTPD